MHNNTIGLVVLLCCLLGASLAQYHFEEDTPTLWQGAVSRGYPKEIGYSSSLDYYCGVENNNLASDVDKSYGCHKGYCWRACLNLFINRAGYSRTHEWCYTKKYGTSGAYKCKSDADCDRCWKCSGACTV